LLVLLLILFDNNHNKKITSEYVPEITGENLTKIPSPVISADIQQEPMNDREDVAGQQTIVSESEEESVTPIPEENETPELSVPEEKETPDESLIEKEEVPVTPTPERVIDPELPMVALTFDDGPYRNNTKAIMEVFEQYNGRATFFVVGYHLDVFYEDTLEAYRRGFQIGNHTTKHPELDTLDGEAAMEEIRSLNKKLNDLGIPGDAMVRPPYGQYTEYLEEHLTVPMIGWNVDSEDWRSKDVDSIYNQIVGKVKDGDIVLLHDLHDVTAEAMQRVVPELAAQGFQLVTVEEMFRAKGIEPQAGKYYYYVR